MLQNCVPSLHWISIHVALEKTDTIHNLKKKQHNKKQVTSSSF